MTRYEHTFNICAKSQEAQDIRVDWSVVLPEQVKAVNHDQLAGLQIANAVASGFYFAVNRNPYGDVEDRYVRLMMPTFYRHRSVLEGYGVKLWPDDLASLSKSLPYLTIFQSLK